MVSRTFKVGQAFGKRGVLSKATQAVPEEVGGGGVTAYANLAAFPSSGNTVGDYAFATDTKAVYIWLALMRANTAEIQHTFLLYYLHASDRKNE